MIEFPFALPHDLFAYHWNKSPGDWDPVNFPADDLPVKWADHEVVREAPDRCAPQYVDEASLHHVYASEDRSLQMRMRWQL
eukprot:8952725-Pyramimonas_sp.AAC.1